MRSRLRPKWCGLGSERGGTGSPFAIARAVAITAVTGIEFEVGAACMSTAAGVTLMVMEFQIAETRIRSIAGVGSGSVDS